MGLLKSLADFFQANPEAVQIAGALLKTVFVMTVVMLSGLILSWVERKQSAIIQDRIGANRAAIVIPGTKLRFPLLGLVHNLADAAKGILKEDFIPPQANPFLHTLAPFLACTTAVMAFVTLPFGGNVTVLGQSIPLSIAPYEVGILWVFAMLSIGVYSVVLAGHVSNNKYGTLGALRGSAQMISYEVATGLTIMGCLMIYQTVDFRGMVAWQSTHKSFFGLPGWGIFTQPLGFILFFVATIVEMKRIPFDLPEGESEIIGYSIEYSGMKFMLFMMAEFIESLLFSWVIVLIFLGGWHVPGLVTPEMGGHTVWMGMNLSYWGAVAIQAAKMAGFIVAICWLQMQIRWSLPRFRYDQIMHLGWKIMLPLALLNLLITAVAVLFV
jgi:NADH-quinone oxidoreductase subunit H